VNKATSLWLAFGLAAAAALCGGPASSAQRPTGTSPLAAPNPFDFPSAIDTPAGRVEHVAGTGHYSYCGGHCYDGPARQCGLGVYGGGWAIDADGNIYIPDCQSNRVYAIIDGHFSPLAGTGARGFRDNCPAGRAHFDLRTYTFHQVCVTGLPAKGKGAVYLADNGRVRRIYLKEGKRWWIETIAGGGTKKLKQGEKAPANDVMLNTYDNSVGADRRQPAVIWIRDQGAPAWEPGLIRITPDGVAEKIRTPKGMNGVALQLDTAGRIYGWRRERNFVRVEPATGKLELVARDNPPNAKEIIAQMKARYGACNPTRWDGPAQSSNFHCPFAMLVAWDGSAVYTGGGDERQLRRIKDGLVKTLFGDGKFYIRQAVKRGAVPGFAPGTPVAIDHSGAVYTRTSPSDGAAALIRYVPSARAQ